MSESLKQRQLFEALSALIDNEASELEVHRILAESEKDVRLRTRWHRYQLARAAMQGELTSIYMGDISDSVRQAVANLDLDAPETAQVDLMGNNATTEALQESSAAETQRPYRGWGANVGRLAIAASVAGAVLFGAQQVSLVAQNPAMSLPGSSIDMAEQSTAPVAEPSSIASELAMPPVNLQTVGRNFNDAPQSSRLPQQAASYSPTLQQQQLQDERVRLYIQQLMLEHAEHSARNSNAGILPFARVPAEAAQ